MSTAPIVGIDLGTTYSLVSVVRDGRPVLLPNALGEVLTPSAVSVDESGVFLVGAPARERAITHPDSTAVCFKRDMGTDRAYTLGGKSMTAPELSAMVLLSLKKDAEAVLGAPVEEAVVTVPAYFGDLQRQATRDAGSIAGLRVDRIINEPTAAALAYGLDSRGVDMHVVVLDLGGGTFDVTVLELIEGVIEIHSTAGDARLGGEDFVDAMAAVAAARIKTEHGIDPRDDRRAWARVKGACEIAKRRLTAAEVAHVALAELRIGKRTLDIDQEWSREEAEGLWKPLLARMATPLQRALRDARLPPERIDEVVLVGGATRMPCVSRLASQMLGRLPNRSMPPDEAVALGAAIQGALKARDVAVADLVVTDVAPFTLGIATATYAGRRVVDGLFSPILERGTVIPASRVERFSTMEDAQTIIRVRVFQGEHSMVAQNQFLGEYTVEGVPKARAGEQSIAVRFTYDLNGILEVECTVVSTGRVVSFVIEGRPGSLSPAEIQKARAEMRRLKMHPRETLPNATALARADALFGELTGEARLEVGAAITRFRAVLETQDPRLIDLAREELLSALLAARPRS